MNRILVIQTAFLGDVVLVTPLLRELRRTHPRARLSVLTTPLGASALEGAPFVDERLVFDKNGADRGLGATWRVGRRLRAMGFDLAIAAHRSFRTGLLLRLSGAATRLGFEGAPGAWAYTGSVPWRGTDHAVHRYLGLAGPAGGDPKTADARPELRLLESAKGSADTLLRNDGVAQTEPLLAIAPGSTWRTKRWGIEGYAEVTRRARLLGLTPVLVGSTEDKDVCEAIAVLAGSGHVLAGRTTVPELAAILARARLLVANDSGTGHVAAAVGTPVVTIFGPTVPAFGYAPYGRDHRIVEHPDLPCRPCHAHGPDVCPLGHHRCMVEIGPDAVLRAIAEMSGIASWEEALDARSASPLFK
jgi:heptosyltransferase-2